MAKKFTKLFLGDVAHTVGSRMFRKLSTEEPVVEDELQGTWVFNDILTRPQEGHVFKEYKLNFTSRGYEYDSFDFGETTGMSMEVLCIHYSRVDSAIYDLTYAYDLDPFVSTIDGWQDTAYQTINITSKLDEVTDGAELLTWLKANATKQGTQEPSLPIWNGTDLTGTTWQLNTTIAYPTAAMAYQINGKMTSGSYEFVSPFPDDNYYRYLRLSTNFLAFPSAQNAVGSGVQYITITRSGNYWYLGGNVNTRLSEPIFTITGGDDVTNTSLISWLKQNGELTSHQMPTPTLINFTIEGTSYQAEEDMTWKEWASSEYNTSEYRWGDTTNRLGYNDGMYQHYIQASGTFVLGDDVIINEFAYTDYKHMGGGAD